MGISIGIQIALRDPPSLSDKERQAGIEQSKRNLAQAKTFAKSGDPLPASFIDSKAIKMIKRVIDECVERMSKGHMQTKDEITVDTGKPAIVIQMRAPKTNIPFDQVVGMGRVKGGVDLGDFEIACDPSHLPLVHKAVEEFKKDRKDAATLVCLELAKTADDCAKIQSSTKEVSIFARISRIFASIFCCFGTREKA